MKEPRAFIETPRSLINTFPSATTMVRTFASRSLFFRPTGAPRAAATRFARIVPEEMARAKKMSVRFVNRILVLIAGALTLPLAAVAQLPTPTYGWNLGNTLEPPDGEGTWGPAATQRLINAVADAGFNTVRLPVAWNSHANPSTYEIDSVWMARVKQVVDWCYAKNLYVILNSHWDRGWLDHHLSHGVDSRTNAKMKAYWTQIANSFRDYDEKLLFAGANEPPAKTSAEMSTLLAYYQTFVNAVRATGGNNIGRWLVVQGPNTDIDRTDTLMNKLPADSTPGRLAVEVHFYSPFPFCLMNKDERWGKMAYFWGKGYHHPTRTNRNSIREEESFVDAEFQKMADKFIRHGIPVILGEFQAFKRPGYSDLTGPDFDLHVASRTYFHRYVVNSANTKGLKPIYWDLAGQMFDWTTGSVVDADNLRALTGGAALLPPGGGAKRQQAATD